MILKALYDYYNRSKGSLPAFGRELKEIGFLIVIGKDGKFIRFEDRRIDKKQAQQFLVKKHVGRSSAPVANYLYDNSAYVFGYSDKGDVDSCRKYLETFISEVDVIHSNAKGDKTIESVFQFYQQDMATVREQMFQDPLWPEISKNLNKKYSTFSFLIDGETSIVAEKDEILDLLGYDDVFGKEQLCLVSGQRGCSVETTTATMIPGSQATAKLVAFQVNSGYDSYGKEKGGNAPISEKAEFAYTTALNFMLRSDSRNKFMIGNRTFLFWASKMTKQGNKQKKAFSICLGSANRKMTPIKTSNKLERRSMPFIPVV